MPQYLDFSNPTHKKLNFLFRNIFAILLIIFFLLVGLYYLSHYNRCNLPVGFSVGNIDTRFNISKAEVEAVAKDAASRWDTNSGRELLKYDPASPLKINLIYDQRQADLDKIRSQVSTLDNENKSITNWSEELDKMIADYQADLSAYENKTNEYNAQVDSWNNKGGAPEPIYTQLQNQKKQLAKEASDLESRRNNINKLANLLDSKTSDYNNSVTDLKNHLDSNRNKIITQGLYYTQEKKIDIFTFGDTNELRLVLMHELGHAMGVDHDKDPASIMNSMLGTQNLTDPKPSGEDEMLLNVTCNLDSGLFNFKALRGFFNRLSSNIS